MLAIASHNYTETLRKAVVLIGTRSALKVVHIQLAENTSAVFW